jgi:hypothetical protein
MEKMDQFPPMAMAIILESHSTVTNFLIKGEITYYSMGAEYYFNKIKTPLLFRKMGFPIFPH